MTNQLTVGILIFTEVEVLDFCGPFEVFSTARHLDKSDDDTQVFDVLTIAKQRGTIRCSGGLLVQPHHAFDDHPPLDMLIVPGGRGTRALTDHRATLDWITAQAASVSLLTSVCTGAGLLGAAGLLDGKRATTHWGAIDWLKQLAPKTTVLENMRFVDEGALVTSAGVSAGIDMSLHIVNRLCGPEIARYTARDMEYDWQP